MLVVFFLCKYGYIVDIVLNGEEVFVVFDCSYYDIIFMDMCMFFMDGFEVICEICKGF